MRFSCALQVVDQHCKQVNNCTAATTRSVMQQSSTLRYRLWTSKQEQEKVPDGEATQRKQESADAKVCCHVLLHLFQMTFKFAAEKTAW